VSHILLRTLASPFPGLRGIFLPVAFICGPSRSSPRFTPCMSSYLYPDGSGLNGLSQNKFDICT
jgi:hypothetical protein